MHVVLTCAHEVDPNNAKTERRDQWVRRMIMYKEQVQEKDGKYTWK